MKSIAGLVFVDVAPEILAGGRGGRTPADSPRTSVPLSLTIHPGTVPPLRLPQRSCSWEMIGGRQPRQWERPHMASLCRKIRPPQHGPEAATSCQGAYGRYRDSGEPVSQVRKRQVTRLEPHIPMTGIRAQPGTHAGPACELPTVPAGSSSVRGAGRTVRWFPL